VFYGLSFLFIGLVIVKDNRLPHRGLSCTVTRTDKSHLRIVVLWVVRIGVDRWCFAHNGRSGPRVADSVSLQNGIAWIRRNC
jgi:hypothetical protein